MESSKKMRFETLVVRGPREESDPRTGAHRIPIYQTSTFVFENVEEGAKAFEELGSRYIYTRLGNPTIDFLEDKIAAIEGAEAGAVTASGMAAISCLVLTLVRPGEKMIASDPLYGGTYKLFKILKERFNIDVTYIRADEFPGRLEEHLDEKVKLVFIETPANPTLTIVNIKRTAEITKKRGIPLAVDNTFATPILQRPLEHGAEIVVHSMTKYLSGHGDTIGGVVVGSREFIDSLKKGTLFDFGGVIAPFNAWLVLRGLKTLSIRMKKHSENAMKIAKYLKNHPKVEKVFYPGLEDHPLHDVAKAQMDGFGGMVSFIVKGGKEAGKKVLNSVKLWTLAVSLGDTDSLIEHPASMTHSSYTDEELLKAGIDPGLIRLSVGIEDPDDLIEDLDEAMKGI